jgi:hypothetical protein
MQVKPRKEYVIVKRIGLHYLGTKDVYFMERRYVVERIAKYQNPKPDADYVAEGLSYKQAKQMMKLFKEN